MGINVTLRRLVFPEWVQKAYDDLGSPQEKEDLIKAMIYSQIQPLEDKNEDGSDRIEISKLLQSGANRVPILENMGHCLWALNMAMTSLAWSKMDERNEVKVIDEEVEKMSKKLEIMIRVDTNDADYDVNTTEITEEELDSIRPIIEAVKNFKPYKGKNGKYEHTHHHNWPSGELCREDLGEKKPEDIYTDLDFETDAMYLFEDLLPGGGEYGFHSIDKIEIYPMPVKETLL